MGKVFSGVGKFVGNTLGALTGQNEATAAAQAAGQAAGQAAMATQAEAKRQFDLINSAGQKLENDVMGEARKYSVQELNALDQSLAVQGRNIANQEKLMASIDPALIEASNQALKLLRGESASSLDPLNNQRAAQRQTLQNSLRSQGLGDGSSAALNALKKFDLETANLGNQAQQSQLQTLLGTSLSARQDLGASAANLANIGGQYGNIASRNAGLIGNVGNTRLGALSGAGQQLIQNAGAQYTGQVLSNQALATGKQNQANQVTGLIGQGLGALAASDERLKENIEDVSTKDYNDFLENLNPKMYNYKDGFGLAKGKHVSIMAQDLQKSKLGRLAIIEEDGYLLVDYRKLMPMVVAALVATRGASV